MVEVAHGTLLGKCVVDGQPIPKCFEAFIDEHRDREMEKEELLGRLGDFGWQVNPETGKLQKL